MEQIPKRRRKCDSLKRWTNEDKEKLFSVIQEDPEKFERPIAQIYYNNIIKNHPQFSEYGWMSMRDKMRYLRIKYTRAIDWRRNTGSGLQVDDPENSIREYILKICPDFYELDSIFGSKKNIEPIYVFKSEVPQYVECTVFEGEDFLTENMSSRSTPVPEPTTPIPEQSTSEPQSSSSEMWKPKKTAKNAMAFLAEAQQSRIIYLEKKMALEEQFNQSKLDIEKKKLELEHEKLQFEKEKAKEELRLKEMELKNNFEIKKLQLMHEKELKIYELNLKYKKEPE